MNATVTLRDDAEPFEGDVALTLRSLPAGAQILRCTATITPVSPHSETVMLNVPTPYEWGVTAQGLIIDFHAQRTVQNVRLQGLAAGNTVTVQMDVGGTWIRLNNDGTMSVPDDGGETNFTITAAGDVDLHQVVTSRVQLTLTHTSAQLASVTWLTTPRNASLRIGDQGPVWFQAGDLREPATSADFAEFLQAYLLEAETENGYHIVPFTLHSDTIARMEVVLTVEYIRQERVLPAGIREVVLPFTHEPLPSSGDELLTLTLPADARVLPGKTRVRAVGTFEPSRIVYDPAAAEPLAGTPAVVPADQVVPVVPISADCAQCQPITVPEDLAATAIDLYVEPGKPVAALSLTILGDAGGKPFGEPLLSRPATIRLDREVNASLGWVSVPLPAEFQFRERGRDGKARRYWLVASSAEGEVSWAARPQEDNGAGLQCSQDNGLSWQTTRVGLLPGTVWDGYFRLRHTPAQFQVPLQLQVGAGEQAQAVPLDRFQPLGRVDFTIDFPEFAAAINRYTREVAPSLCSEENHLANSDFDEWIDLPDESQILEDWEPAGLEADRGTTFSGATFASLMGIGDRVGALSQVVPVSGGCPYEIEFRARVHQQGTVVEVIWLLEDCSGDHIDRIDLPFEPDEFGYVNFKLHRVRLQAPAGAMQAEVRFLVRPGNIVDLDYVSLAATPEALVNQDLREVQEDDKPIHWIVIPEEAVTDLDISEAGDGRTTIENDSQVGQTISVAQQVSTLAGYFYLLEFHGQVDPQAGAAFPQLELHWQNDEGLPAGDPLVQVLTPADRNYLLEGTVPAGTTQAELRLVLPAQSSIRLERMSLRFTEPISVPLTFLTQAPGELAISDLQIAYDRIVTPPPPVPDTGLCSPTPPGQQPGETPHESCYCAHCQTRREMVAVERVVTAAGRPALAGRCPNCGAPLVRLGGSQTPHALRSSLLRRRGATTFINPDAVTAREDLSSASFARPPLTAISGIAETRAERLAAADIASLERLAVAAPMSVASMLPGVSVEMAAKFVAEGKVLLAASLEQAPLVTCIMPTYNRRPFVVQAIAYFLRQDYPHRELIIVDDGTDPVSDLVPEDERIRYVRLSQQASIGAKKNLACEQAHSDIIVHWDDDDWMADWRLTYQVSNLLNLNADVCGLNRLFHYDAVNRRAWQFTYPADGKPWLADGTLCYTISFWQRNPFPDLTAGASIRFLRSKQPKRLLALPDSRFYVSLIHPHNSRPIHPRPPQWRSYPLASIQVLMGADWSFYSELLPGEHV